MLAAGEHRADHPPPSASPLREFLSGAMPRAVSPREAGTNRAAGQRRPRRQKLVHFTAIAVAPGLPLNDTSYL